jgi:hypothetical protein
MHVVDSRNPLDIIIVIIRRSAMWYGWVMNCLFDWGPYPVFQLGVTERSWLVRKTISVLSKRRR